MNLGKLFDQLKEYTLKESVEESVVKKAGGKRRVESKKGKNMGEYDTKENAEKRLKQVEMFKHMNKNKKKTNEADGSKFIDHEPYREYSNDAASDCSNSSKVMNRCDDEPLEANEDKLEDPDAMKAYLDKLGVSAEQYAKDENNPTEREIKNAYMYFLQNPPEKEIKEMAEQTVKDLYPAYAQTSDGSSIADITVYSYKEFPKIEVSGEEDTFGPINAAEEWLKKNGYIKGSMQGDAPIGFADEDKYNYISKWRNMEPGDWERLDGVIIPDPEFREGGVIILFFKKDNPVESVKDNQ